MPTCLNSAHFWQGKSLGKRMRASRACAQPGRSHAKKCVELKNVGIGTPWVCPNTLQLRPIPVRQRTHRGAPHCHAFVVDDAVRHAARERGAAVLRCHQGHRVARRDAEALRTFEGAGIVFCQSPIVLRFALVVPCRVWATLSSTRPGKQKSSNNKNRPHQQRGEPTPTLRNYRCSSCIALS